MPGDLRDPKLVGDLVAAAKNRSGRLDVLVNAAGIQLRKPAIQVEEEEWQRLLGVNLSAAYALVRAGAPGPHPTCGFDRHDRIPLSNPRTVEHRPVWGDQGGPDPAQQKASRPSSDLPASA